MKVPQWARKSDDEVVKFLVRNGVPVTRRNYIQLSYFGDKNPSEFLGAECEASLPKQLQKRGGRKGGGWAA